jgi:hypothetical protein
MISIVTVNFLDRRIRCVDRIGGVGGTGRESKEKK